MREIIDRFRELFFESLDSKPSWGREEIKNLFMLTLVSALLGKKAKDESNPG